MIPDYVFNYFIDFLFRDLREFCSEIILYKNVDLWDIIIFSAVMIAFADTLFYFKKR